MGDQPAEAGSKEDMRNIRAWMVTSMVSIIMLIDVVSAPSSHPAYLRGNRWEEPDRTHASALGDQTTQVFTPTATATSMPSVPLPDLMVSRVDNGGFGHGCAGVWGYSYRACILNRGEAPAASFDVQLYGIGGRLETVGGLDADEETCLSGGGTITAVVVDVFNDVAELDETNNVARHFGGTHTWCYVYSDSDNHPYSNKHANPNANATAPEQHLPSGSRAFEKLS